MSIFNILKNFLNATLTQKLHTTAFAKQTTLQHSEYHTHAIKKKTPKHTPWLRLLRMCSFFQCASAECALRGLHRRLWTGIIVRVYVCNIRL